MTFLSLHLFVVFGLTVYDCWSLKQLPFLIMQKVKWTVSINQYFSRKLKDLRLCLLKKQRQGPYHSASSIWYLQWCLVWNIPYCIQERDLLEYINRIFKSEQMQTKWKVPDVHGLYLHPNFNSSPLPS
jgi:hypothetical protein